MVTWYTSDLHFGHGRIIELCNRPFRDVTHMDEELIRRWNERVDPQDEVWILGDLAMGSLDKSLARVARLNGFKMLVPGNHDRVWPGFRHSGLVRPEDTRRYEDAGLWIAPLTVTNDHGWTLCHFPDVGDSHEEDRFTAYRPPPPRPGEILVHGHVHERWRWADNRINVGVDVWDFAPVPESRILEWAKTL